MALTQVIGTNTGHNIREEMWMWELDGLSDTVTVQLIINTDDDYKTSSNKDNLLSQVPMQTWTKCSSI
jgi:hypothetical protein